MKVLLMVFVGFALAVPVLAEEGAVSRREMEEMKARLERMESALKQQEAVIEKQRENIDEQAWSLKGRKEAAAPVGIEDEKWQDKLDLSFWATGVLHGQPEPKRV